MNGYTFQVQVFPADGGWIVSGPSTNFVRQTVEEALAAARAEFDAFVRAINEQEEE